MARKTTKGEGQRPVEREVRFAIPYWTSVAVLVNEPGDKPDLDGRRTPTVVLDGPIAELTSAHVGARVERLRAMGIKYLVVPADVYPWLERHPELRRFLRTQFRRLEADEDVCLVYSLQSRDEPDVPAGEDGLPVPPPEMIALVAGQIEPEEFYPTGRFAVTWISEMVERNGGSTGDLGAILDFGCGCGRVIRHWPALTGAALHGCDYNPHLVRWCVDNLPFGDFRVNDLEPPLPYDDESFDLLYALSVLTHLDEPQQLAWMEELVRVVRPGGMLLLTFHGRSRVEALRQFGTYDKVAPGFEAGELVVMGAGTAGGNGCAAYHPERYIRDVLAKGLEVLHYAPGGALDIQQDAVLFRKP